MSERNITFRDLGLSDAMLRALEAKGYGWPTTIQAEAIPHFMQWKDVIAKAPTGTGKTFAFGIPMIEHVDPESEAVQGLILAPTRELAIQIGDELIIKFAADQIKGAADFVVDPLCEDNATHQPSQIIKVGLTSEIEIIRE